MARTRLEWMEAAGGQPWLVSTVHDLHVELERVWFHDHEFHELFWVEDGIAIHECAGVRTSVAPGQVVFIRPADCHRLGAQAQGCRVCTLGFRSALIEETVARYAGEIPLDPWGRPAAEPPRVMAFTATAIDGIRAAAEQAARSRRRLDADLVALRVLAAMAAPRAAQGPTPAWLQDAIAALHLSPLIAGGMPTLVRLCGRSALHVERSVRRHLGCTPTALITRLRMERAGKLLRHRGRPVREVAAEVGMLNLGHFYACFRAHFGTSPGRYRRSGLVGDDAPPAHRQRKR